MLLSRKWISLQERGFREYRVQRSWVSCSAACRGKDNDFYIARGHFNRANADCLWFICVLAAACHLAVYQHLNVFPVKVRKVIQCTILWSQTWGMRVKCNPLACFFITRQQAPHNTLLNFCLDSLLILFNFIGGLEASSMKSNLMNECALLIKALKLGLSE